MINELTQKNEMFEEELQLRDEQVRKLESLNETIEDIKAQRDQFKQFYQTEQHARALLSE